MPSATPPYDGPGADIGVIGGSGFYAFLDDAMEVRLSTPWGDPSDPLMVGEIGGRRVAFVPRHGRDHRFPPHRVNYRANLWALRTVGVRQVVAPCAVGSLTAALAPGAVVVPDQIVDRTYGRGHTFFDGDDGVGHVSFAEPFCPRGRSAAIATAQEHALEPVPRGTLVVINGPRFSSGDESRWHASQGWSIVGMTAMPEAGLARELALCFTTIALVTDHDAGVEAGEPVTHEEVLRVFAGNIGRLRSVLMDLIPALPAERDDCDCAHALDGIPLPFALP
jgi:5'-methylthioadenosine phosphorylase